jgi:hypothetical protein
MQLFLSNNQKPITMKNVRFLILIITVLAFVSCKKTEKVKVTPTIIEQTSSYFEKNKNVVIYYTKSENIDSIRTALVKEMDRLTKEKNIDFFDKKDKSKLICFNDKELMPDVTNNPDQKLKGRYSKSIICILNGTSWGNHQFLYGGVKNTYKGNISGFKKVIFKDKKTGKWEE